MTDQLAFLMSVLTSRNLLPGIVYGYSPAAKVLPTEHQGNVRHNGRVTRDAEPMADAERIAEIYNRYVLGDIATFELDEVGEAVMANRIAAVQSAGLPWIVATDVLGVIGYAYASPFHERAAYSHTLSTSVYLDAASRGRGVGSALYRELLRRVALIDEPPHAPVHTLIAGIALPNDASVGLHESLGFRRVGTLEQAGRKFEQWIDVGYWQKDLGPTEF